VKVRTAVHTFQPFYTTYFNERTAMIRVRFLNGTDFSVHWVVTDDYNNGATVLDRTMGPKETFPSVDSGSWLNIEAPDGTYGEVTYNQDGGTPTRQQMISDMDTVDMF
jgi:hypothetical protein